MKSYLELICTCKLCKLEWRINLNHHIKGVGTGSHIDGYQCPNCTQKDIDFDIMRVSYPCHEYIHIKHEDLENLKRYRIKCKQLEAWIEAEPLLCSHCDDDFDCKCVCHKKSNWTSTDTFSTNTSSSDFVAYMNRERTKEDIESLEEADKFYGDKNDRF